MNAMSNRPAPTSPASRAEPAWLSWISTPGWAMWNRASTAGTSTTPMHCSVPTARVPRNSPLTAAAACLTATTLASAWRASSRVARPSSVSSTRRVLRTNSGAPNSRSNALIDADSPDWETSRRLAALVK